jgi:hypothetical protein
MQGEKLEVPAEIGLLSRCSPRQGSQGCPQGWGRLAGPPNGAAGLPGQVFSKPGANVGCVAGRQRAGEPPLGSLPRGPGARRARNPWLQRVDARHLEEQQDNDYRQGKHHGDNRDRSVCSRCHVTTLQVLSSRWSCSPALAELVPPQTGAAGGSRLQIRRRSPLAAAARRRTVTAPVRAGRDRPDSAWCKRIPQRGAGCFSDRLEWGLRRQEWSRIPPKRTSPSPA